VKQGLWKLIVGCLLMMILIVSSSFLIVSAAETYEGHAEGAYTVVEKYTWDFSNTSIEELSKSWTFNAMFQDADQLNGLDESAASRPGNWVIGNDNGNKVLYQDQGEDSQLASVALFTGVKAKNFVADFRMKWLRKDDWGLHTGFVFRNATYEQFYRIAVIGRFRLFRRTTIPYIGVPATDRIRWGPTGSFDHNPVIGKWIWIRVEAIGDLVTLWYSLDGEEYVLYWDHRDEQPVLNEGYLGFFAYGPAMFDDFTLRILE
jgi:hypothetical protein